MSVLIMLQLVGNSCTCGCNALTSTTDSNHLECDPHSAQGCSCCHIMQPTVCCDIHDPSVFSLFEADVPRMSQTTQWSYGTKYTQTEQDHMLGDAIHDWREEKTSAIFGWATLNDFGPCLVMPNSTLDCIVDCAHRNKIKTLQDLKKETGWTEADRLGNELIALIQRHIPPYSSPLASTLLSRQVLQGSVLSSLNLDSLLPLPWPTPITSAPVMGPCQLPTTSSGGGHVRCRNKCSACRQEGHNGTFYSTPH